MSLDVDHLSHQLLLACHMFEMYLGPPMNDLLVCLHWKSLWVWSVTVTPGHTLCIAPPQGGRTLVNDTPECGQET